MTLKVHYKLKRGKHEAPHVAEKLVETKEKLNQTSFSRNSSDVSYVSP